MFDSNRSLIRPAFNLAITPHIIRNIHQPDADLAAYWSGTDGAVKSRPITVEKMDTMKVESRGSSLLPGAVASPIRQQPIIVPTTPTDPETLGAPPAVIKPTTATPNPTGAAIKPASSQGTLVAPEAKTPAAVPAVSYPAGVSREFPRGVPANAGSAGMSDAVVDPTQAQ